MQEKICQENASRRTESSASSNKNSLLIQLSRSTIGGGNDNVNASFDRAQEKIQKDVSGTKIADMRRQSSAEYGGVAVGVISFVSASSNLDPVQEKIQKDRSTRSVVLTTTTESSANDPARHKLQNDVSNPWQNPRNCFFGARHQTK